VISKLQSIIEEEGGVRFDQGSLSQARLMIHLRFSMERLYQQPMAAPTFAQYVKNEYPSEYQLARKLSAVMAEDLGTEVPEEETAFLAMHLYRLFQTHAKTNNRKDNTQ
jgi:transcriptional antiterminator